MRSVFISIKRQVHQVVTRSRFVPKTACIMLTMVAVRLTVEMELQVTNLAGKQQRCHQGEQAPQTDRGRFAMTCLLV